MAKRIIFIGCREKGKTISGQYYEALLQHLKVEVKSKRSHLAKKTMFHHDKALANSLLNELKF